MTDGATETIELTRSEAREVINALSKRMYEVSGRDERVAFNTREFLQREFGFKEGDFDDDTTLTDIFLPGSDDTHEIQLSAAEAAEIVPALTALEAKSDPEEAQTIADLRERFEERFDLDTESTA